MKTVIVREDLGLNRVGDVITAVVVNDDDADATVAFVARKFPGAGLVKIEVVPVDTTKDWHDTLDDYRAACDEALGED